MQGRVAGSLLLGAVVALASGCAPCRIKSGFGSPPRGEEVRDLVVLGVHDLRGRGVTSAAHTVTVDLPDTASTTYQTYGDTTYATTTYTANSATLRTGNTLGTPFVADVDAKLQEYMRKSSRFADVPFVPAEQVVSLDDANLTRLARSHKVRRVAIVDLARYEFESDADGLSLTWAYLGGLTLGLAMPFLPLERWDARVELTADVYLWEVGQGLVQRRPLDEAYRQRGAGVPTYRRALSATSSWADTRIAEDILEAIASMCDAG